MTDFKPISRVDLLKICHEFINDFESDYIIDGKLIDGVNYIMVSHYISLKSILK